MLPELPQEIQKSVKKFQQMVTQSGNISDKEIDKVLTSHINKIQSSRMALERMADNLTRFEGSYVGICSTIHQIIQAKQLEEQEKIEKAMDADVAKKPLLEKDSEDLPQEGRMGDQDYKMKTK